MFGVLLQSKLLYQESLAEKVKGREHIVTFYINIFIYPVASDLYEASNWI